MSYNNQARVRFNSNSCKKHGRPLYWNAAVWLIALLMYLAEVILINLLNCILQWPLAAVVDSAVALTSVRIRQHFGNIITLKSCMIAPLNRTYISQHLHQYMHALANVALNTVTLNLERVWMARGSFAQKAWGSYSALLPKLKQLVVN